MADERVYREYEDSEVQLAVKEPVRIMGEQSYERKREIKSNPEFLENEDVQQDFALFWD